MGWLFIVLLALVILVAVWRLGRLDRNGLQFTAAALLLALAGYAWQGRPDLAGEPRRAPAHKEVAPSDFSRKAMSAFKAE